MNDGDVRLDDALRERFAQLKADEAGRAPDFGRMYASAQAEAEAGGEAEAQAETLADEEPSAGADILPIRSTAHGRRGRTRSLARSPWTWVAGSLAAAALAGIMVLGPDQGDAEFEALVTAFAASSSGWKAPTDDLMEVPGMDLLRTMPTIDLEYGAPSAPSALPRSNDDITG